MRFYQGESFLEMVERIPKTPFQRDLSIVDRIGIDGDYFVAREPREHQDSACVGYKLYIFAYELFFVDGYDGDILDPFFHLACAGAFHMASTARLESFDAP